MTASDHVLGHEAARLQLLRIEPDADRVLAGAEHGDAADAVEARDLVEQVDGGVVRQKQAVVAAVGRGQRHDLEDRGRFLVGLHALLLHALGQRGERARHAVLDQDLRLVAVGADLEGDGERVLPVAGRERGHVDHALDAVDALLDRQRDLARDCRRAGAGIARGHHHRRRGDVGILRDRQAEQRDDAEDHDQQRDHVGEDRPIDEELGDHLPPLSAPPRTP